MKNLSRSTALNRILMSRKTAECDHYPVSFIELVETFLKQNSLLFEQVMVRFNVCKRRWCLTDPDLLAKWQVFHQSQERLRWATGRGNKIQSDSGYRKCKRRGIGRAG